MTSLWARLQLNPSTMTNAVWRMSMRAVAGDLLATLNRIFGIHDGFSSESCSSTEYMASIDGLVLGRNHRENTSTRLLNG